MVVRYSPSRELSVARCCHLFHSPLCDDDGIFFPMTRSDTLHAALSTDYQLSRDFESCRR